MKIPAYWPQPDPGGGWSHREGARRCWWAVLPPAWAVRFCKRGLPVDWVAARRLVEGSSAG